MYPQYEEFEVLKGQTIVRYEFRYDGSPCAQGDANEVLFYMADGRVYKLWHEQDCCESVHLAEVEGNLDDLLDVPLGLAELVTQEGERGEYDESSTWSFYKLAGQFGYATLRWLGTSNGYYSETVSFAEVTP